MLISFRSMPRARYQRGSLRKVGKLRKSWEGHWYEYRQLPEGEKAVHRKRVLGLCAKMTKAQAQVELDRLIREGTPVGKSAKQISETTVAEWSDRYQRIKFAGWTPHNRAVMASLFRRHIAPQLGSMALKELTREKLQEHLNALAETGLSYSILHKVRTHLKAMLDEAIEADILTKNPARLLDVPKTAKRVRDVRTEEECLRLLAAAQGRDYLILRLAITLGLRPGEIFGLRTNDILPGALMIDEAVMEAQAGEPKTLNSKGSVPMPPSLEGELRAFVRQNNLGEMDWLFAARTGKPLRQNLYVRRNLVVICRAAGVPATNFQVLRRTFATVMQRHGNVKDVQAAMRHAKPDLTAGTYMQELSEGARLAVASWDKALGVKGGVQ